MTRLVWLSFIAVCAGACVGDESISQDPVAGTLGGVAWETAASTFTMHGAAGAPSYVTVKLYATVPTDPCSPDPQLDSIAIHFPARPGTFDFSFDNEAMGKSSAVTWITFDTMSQAKDGGRIEISSVSESRILGGVIADFADGQLNGSFDPMTSCGYAEAPR